MRIKRLLGLLLFLPASVPALAQQYIVNVEERPSPWVVNGCTIGPKAQCANVDLRFQDLRNADLSGANLRGAKLSRADLRHANLNGADLSDAEPISAGQSSWAPTSLSCARARPTSTVPT
jgi:hypothetical protein